MDYEHEIDDSAMLQYIILYILYCARTPVGYDTLVNIITDACNMNFLEFQISLTNLTENGFVEFFVDERNAPMYEATEKALTAAPLFEKDIPVYIRNPLKDAMKIRLADAFEKSRTHVEIIPVKKDEYAVHCDIYDIDNTRLMSLEFYAGSNELASEIAQRFSLSPDAVFEKITRALTQD